MMSRLNSLVACRSRVNVSVCETSLSEAITSVDVHPPKSCCSKVASFLQDGRVNSKVARAKRLKIVFFIVITD